jgi:hypothetical protein
MLTPTQQTTLATALRASVVPEVVAALAVRNDVALAAWCNTITTTDAWNANMDANALFDAGDLTKFDNLSASKREAWRLMLDFAPYDFGKPSPRKAIQDIWGDIESVAVLQACTRKATNAEVILGGSSETRNTVTALDLEYDGLLYVDDVSIALNLNP